MYLLIAFATAVIAALMGCSSNDGRGGTDTTQNTGGSVFGSGGQGVVANGGSENESGGISSTGGATSTTTGGGTGIATGGVGGAIDMGGGGVSAGTGGVNTSSGGVSASTGGDGAQAAGDGGSVGTGGAPSQQALPPTSDYLQRGPFATTTMTSQGPNGNYTIFRPDPLGENGFIHSPIIFGPGILTTASMYANALDHFASHGFVTICVNSLSGGPNDPGNLQAMQAGLDWLIAQNSTPGSIFEGKLAVDRAIGMGYSIGATASTQLSSHPAIITTVSIHGHNTSGDPHGPELLLTGTNDVIDDNRATLATLTEAPAMLAALPIGHLDVLTEFAMTVPVSATTRYIAPITAWLRYWINGDQDAKRYFWGADCLMCTSPWITPETNALWSAQML